MPVALSQSVARLPDGPGWWYEPKFDGHRIVLWRDPDAVRLHTRSGRDVTDVWPDLAAAGMEQLPQGTVLDGEAVIWVGGRLSFSAVQSRAASAPTRARVLAVERPATYAVWDVLQHAELGDVRPWPYVERRRLLLEVLAAARPPIQPVPATDDLTVAAEWYTSLQAQGIEGIVAKPARSAYRPARIWRKVRHAETVDVPVVGYTGAAARPRHLAVRLPDGRTALTQRLTGALAAAAAAHLAAAAPGPRARTAAGEPYTATDAELVVEVLAGTTRHATVAATRVR